MSRAIDGDKLFEYIQKEKAWKQFTIQRPRYDKGKQDAYYEMLEIIQEQPTIQLESWIPVSERLPQNEKRVLICANRKCFDGKVIQISTTAMYEDGTMRTNNSGFYWEDNDFEYDEETDDYIIPEGWYEQNIYCEEFGVVDDSVIAWMSLPEPFKEEK